MLTGRHGAASRGGPVRDPAQTLPRAGLLELRHASFLCCGQESRVPCSALHGESAESQLPGEGAFTAAPLAP